MVQVLSAAPTVSPSPLVRTSSQKATAMTVYIVAGLMIVITTLILMSRMNLRRFLGYPNTVDISFTVMMLVMFHDTFSGIVAAAFAGLFMSVLLNVLRGILGAERLQWVKSAKRFRPAHLAWVRVSAQDCRPHWLTKLFTMQPKASA